jgi:hypothetical protein
MLDLGRGSGIAPGKRGSGVRVVVSAYFAPPTAAARVVRANQYSTRRVPSQLVDFIGALDVQV